MAHQTAAATIATAEPLMDLIAATREEVHLGWQGPQVLLSELFPVLGKGAASATAQDESAGEAAPASSSAPPVAATPGKRVGAMEAHVHLLFQHAPATTLMVCKLLGVCDAGDSSDRALDMLLHTCNMQQMVCVSGLVSTMLQYHNSTQATPLQQSLSMMLYMHKTPHIIMDALCLQQVTLGPKATLANVHCKLDMDYKAHEHDEWVDVYDNINIHLIPQLL